jgi:hypothetical protein
MANKLALTVNGKTYFRVSHVGTMLGVHKITVEKLIAQGAFTPVQLKENGPLYIPMSEVSAYLKKKG